MTFFNIKSFSSWVHRLLHQFTSRCKDSFRIANPNSDPDHIQQEQQQQQQQQRRRIHDFFQHQIILVLGASPTPPIHKSLQGLFSNCKSIQGWDRMSLPRGQVLCYPTTTTTTTTNSAATASKWDDLLPLPLPLEVDDNDNDNDVNETKTKANDFWTMLLHDGFYPTDHGHLYYNHSVDPGTTVLTELEKIRSYWWGNNSNSDSDSDDSNSTIDSNSTNNHNRQHRRRLLKFTIMIEQPTAHMQNQDLMTKSYDYAASLQELWVQVFLNATNDSNDDDDDNNNNNNKNNSSYYKERMESLGIEISNVIAFDGSPQFFPTESGGYLGQIRTFHSEQEFIERNGYDGWIAEEYGSRCRGFLPPTSNLTKFNQLGRDAYERNGLDMRFYGRTWEFINLAWFGMHGTLGWGPKGLDCTHGSGAVSEMHKYFVMAMVDDHFDNMMT